MLRLGRPPVQVGLVPPDEEEAFLRLLCAGFGFDLPTARPYFYDDPYYPPQSAVGVMGGGRAVAHVGFGADGYPVADVGG
jgi:hypothetical protein